MNGKGRRTSEYLDHMVLAIDRIQSYFEDRDRQAFDADPRQHFRFKSCYYKA
jgi:uncharacterized protein with HEPN domain